MASEEYYKMETFTKVFDMDWIICGVNEWIPLPLQKRIARQNFNRRSLLHIPLTNTNIIYNLERALKETFRVKKAGRAKQPSVVKAAPFCTADTRDELRDVPGLVTAGDNGQAPNTRVVYIYQKHFYYSIVNGNIHPGGSLFISEIGDLMAQRKINEWKKFLLCTIQRRRKIRLKEGKYI